MKKLICFYVTAAAAVLMMLTITACRKEGSLRGKSGKTISGILMDENHNAVRNGELHLHIAAGSSGSGIGFCEATHTVVGTDNTGYFSVTVAQDCEAARPLELKAFNEEGAQFGGDIFAYLHLHSLSQDHIDKAGFNSKQALFFPKGLGYFTNHVTLGLNAGLDFDMSDTLYFILPPDNWKGKGWHSRKVPVSEIANGSGDFSFKWTFPMPYFLSYYTQLHPYAIFVTSDKDLLPEKVGSITRGHIFDMDIFLNENAWLKDLTKIKHPHQNIGGDNHIKLTVRKENGSIVVVKED